MTTYTACFEGKELGAIGVSSWFNVEIDAPTIPEAELKLYDTHDHISKLFWLWKGKQTVKNHAPEDIARCGQVYVSTYTGIGWMQTNCNLSDVDRIKAEHLARIEK